MVALSKVMLNCRGHCIKEPSSGVAARLVFGMRKHLVIMCQRKPLLPVSVHRSYYHLDSNVIRIKGSFKILLHFYTFAPSPSSFPHLEFLALKLVFLLCSETTSKKCDDATQPQQGQQ